MTSAVKYHDDARTRRAVASLGPAPDFVDARGGRKWRDGALWGDTEIAPPLAIVDCEPSTALGFVGRCRNTLTRPGPGGARFMMRTRATGRDGACNGDG
jgi:hypothetical protein